MRDDRNDPFDDFFREIERMMNDMMGADAGSDRPAGFGGDTHVDVQELDGEIRIVADLPGVEKDDLSLQCDGEYLTVSATTAHREFDERIHLPARVDEEHADASFNNGVLEVRFPRADDSANISLD